MPVTVDAFLKHLSDSGVWSSADLLVLESKIPPGTRNHDAEWLATELVRRKQLTQFQATALCAEKPLPLILGNYLLQEIIGTGGMGVVYKASHRRMKRVVAVKMLSPTAIASRGILKRFLREAQTAAQLTHPNIVAAYDADEFNGVPFLAMEFVDGVDLAVHVKQNGPMKFEQALDCLLQAAKGLEHAHLQGVIHRDIKPANILLDIHGTIKILDMGLARFADGKTPISTVDLASTSLTGEITHTGSIVGTVDFMSPEQAIDSSSADHLSDEYSLGATLYFLISGKPMYEHKNLMDRILAHREAPLPSLRTIDPSIPPQVDWIFRRMVAKDKENRYASMTDVIRHLTNWRKLKPSKSGSSFKTTSGNPSSQKSPTSKPKSKSTEPPASKSKSKASEPPPPKFKKPSSSNNIIDAIFEDDDE